jgi:hypothetical protein
MVVPIRKKPLQVDEYTILVCPLKVMLKAENCSAFAAVVAALIDPEDTGKTILRNARTFQPNYLASQSKRHKPSCTSKSLCIS